MHCWISEVTNISNIVVQLFWHDEHEVPPAYVSFSQKWHLSGSQKSQSNKHYAILPSTSLLCDLGVSCDPSAACSDTQHQLHGSANTVFCSILPHIYWSHL